MYGMIAFTICPAEASSLFDLNTNRPSLSHNDINWVSGCNFIWNSACTRHLLQQCRETKQKPKLYVLHLEEIFLCCECRRMILYGENFWILMLVVALLLWICVDTLMLPQLPVNPSYANRIWIDSLVFVLCLVLSPVQCYCRNITPECLQINS